MRRRILLAILSITGAAVLLLGVPLSIVVDRLVEEDATLRIEQQAVLAARDVPGDYRTSADPVELPAAVDGVRLVLYDAAGILRGGDGSPNADPIAIRALQNQIVTSETEDALVVAIPVTANETVIGVIRGEQSIARSNARTLRIVALIAAIGLGLIGVGALIAYVIAGRLAGPVRRLRDAAVKLGDGDFTIGVSRSGVPELDDAADALALTARRLDDLVSRERSFSADASHQLRTPLAGLRSGIETELAFPRADPSDILRESLEDIARLERTISELLSLARTPSSAASTFELADVQRELTNNWHGRFAAAGRRLTISDAPAQLRLAGSGAILRHAIDVLLDNALVHGDGETRIDHTVGPDSVTITVSNEGPGIVAPAGEGGHPNGDVTSREDHSAHGLGLPLAERLVKTLPGRLSVAHAGRNPRVDIVIGIAGRAVLG